MIQRIFRRIPLKLMLLVSPYLPKRKYNLLTFVHNAVVCVESGYILFMFGREMFKYLETNSLGFWGLYCDPLHNLDRDHK